jgi:Ca2+-binding RTX toxin-like protein
MAFVQRSKPLRAGVAFYLLVGMLLVIPGSTANAAPPRCGGLSATIVGTPGDDVLKGTESDDVIVGLAGDDRMVGLGGNDTICGKDGNDILIGGPGDDTLLGGDGSDTAGFGGAPAVEIDLAAGTATGSGTDSLASIENAIGSEFGDTIAGDAGPNVLRGNGGADQIHGRAGNDTVVGGPDDDALSGGLGDDALSGNLGNDQLLGMDGDDRLEGGAGDDVLVAGRGNDLMFGGVGTDSVDYSRAKERVRVNLTAGTAQAEGTDSLAGIGNVTGSPFGDIIVGNYQPNALLGLGGNDVIEGKSGDDTIDGGYGHDELFGGPGHDTIVGAEGKDVLRGADGRDALSGGNHDDLILGGLLADAISGGPGNDTLRGGGGNDTVRGEDGADTIDGGLGSDDLSGGLDEDAVVPGPGDDTITGGFGADWVIYRQSRRAVKVNLSAGTASGSGRDTMAGIEHVAGTARDDVVKGNWQSNEILGRGGNDLIHGAGGDDTIAGGRGADDLWGDAGDDELYGWAGPDVIHGGFGNDLLDGGGGVDELYGGGGEDTCLAGESYATCETPEDPVWGSLPWPTLSGIRYADAVPTELQGRLKSDGFAIEDYEHGRYMSPIYEAIYQYHGRPVFVTTDAAYHHWHLVFDKILRDTEQDTLLPILEDLVVDLLSSARAQTTDLAGTDLADAALRVEEYLEAVATVLELNVGPIGPRAAAEVQLVNEHVAFVVSPTVGGACPNSCVDYSRMKPRGHYTRSDELKRFFKGMSMLGNIGFVLAQTGPFRVGLLLTRVIVTDAGITADWERIYEATAVIVGASDDYTPYEAEEAASAMLPGWLADPSGLASDATVAAIADELEAMRPVRINPEAASLRAMGVRFILDSYILDQLAHPNVWQRGAVSALDVAAAFGSDWALDRQHDNDPTTLAVDYADQMEAMRDKVEGRSAEAWNATVYDSWLLALEPAFLPNGSEAPPFMRTDEWEAKSHQSGFGSYTELKHDTILYGKEGMAEGDGPPPPPEVLHWVEPDPVVFARVTATSQLFRDVLLEQDLLPENGDEWSSLRTILEDWIEISSRLADIAADEVANGRPSAADSEWLDTIGGRLNSLLWRTGDGHEIDPFGGIVADIFLNGFADEVLEQGTGLFDLIYVIVPGINGFQVATGAVYSYYEFWQPRSDRLTDEQWWEMLRTDDLPPRPFWVQEYLGL